MHFPFQSEFFNYVTLTYAGEAAPFLARLALLMGHDSEEFSFPVEQLCIINDYSSPQGEQGLHEFYALECLRCILLNIRVEWKPSERQALEDIAKLSLYK